MIKNKANFCVGARVFDLASRFDSEVVPVIVDFPLVLDFRNSAAAAKTFVLVLHFHLGVFKGIYDFDTMDEHLEIVSETIFMLMYR